MDNQTTGQGGQQTGSGNQGQTPQQPMQNQDSKRMILSVLAYLGILVIIPLLVNKEDKSVKFHTSQGLVLLCIEAATWVITSAFPPIGLLMGIVNLAVLILSILGIINVVQHKEKELPLVGHFASYFNF